MCPTSKNPHSPPHHHHPHPTWGCCAGQFPVVCRSARHRCSLEQRCAVKCGSLVRRTAVLNFCLPYFTLTFVLHSGRSETLEGITSLLCSHDNKIPLASGRIRIKPRVMESKKRLPQSLLPHHPLWVAPWCARACWMSLTDGCSTQCASVVKA